MLSSVENNFGIVCCYQYNIGFRILWVYSKTWRSDSSHNSHIHCIEYVLLVRFCIHLAKILHQVNRKALPLQIPARTTLPNPKNHPLTVRLLVTSTSTGTTWTKMSVLNWFFLEKLFGTNRTSLVHSGGCQQLIRFCRIGQGLAWAGSWSAHRRTSGSMQRWTWRWLDGWRRFGMCDHHQWHGRGCRHQRTCQDRRSGVARRPIFVVSDPPPKIAISSSIYLESEDLWLNEVERLAIDLDKTLSGLFNILLAFQFIHIVVALVGCV